MPTADLNDVLDNLSRYVWLSNGGFLSVDSRLWAMLGDKNYHTLIECVERNTWRGSIYYANAARDFIKATEAAGAVRDFRKAKGEKDA